MNFILGFFTGGSFGYLIYISFLHNYNLGTYFIFDNVFWLSTLIPGMICGIITHYKQKEISIILTCLIGPILIIIPLEKLLEKKQYIKNELILMMIYFITYIFFSLTGFRIQKKRNNENRRINYSSSHTLRERQYLETF